jgi:hypothetical protein
LEKNWAGVLKSLGGGVWHVFVFEPCPVLFPDF